MKLTFKRKAQKGDQNEELKDLDRIKEERHKALQSFEQNRHLSSPRPFDFGFLPIPRTSLAVTPQQWI